MDCCDWLPADDSPFCEMVDCAISATIQALRPPFDINRLSLITVIDWITATLLEVLTDDDKVSGSNIGTDMIVHEGIAKVNGLIVRSAHVHCSVCD